MATCKKLMDWLDGNIDTFDIRFEEMCAPFDWLPWRFDFKAMITIDDRTYIGRGKAFDQSTALTISLVEAFERYVSKLHGFKNSSGIAGHESLALAAAAATNELIERDAFFCHYLTKTPFFDFQGPKSEKFLQAEVELKKTGIEIKQARLKSVGPNHAVICSAFGENFKTPFGVTLGLSCHQDLQFASDHALKECLVNVVPLLCGTPVPKIPLSEFDALESPRPSDHFALGLNVQAADIMKALFSCRDEIPTHSIVPAISVEQLEFFNAPLNEIPFYFVNASCTQLQNAFFGHLSKQIINTNRLSCFKGVGLTMAEINTQPHIFG